MKKKIITITMLAMLSAGLSSCQKETFDIETTVPSARETVLKTVYYSVDGKQFRRTLANEQELQELHEWLFSLAREGHRIEIRDANTPVVNFSKDVQTFVTTNQEEAIKWCQKMEGEHYIVTIVYDERTGIYTCTAIR